MSGKRGQRSFAETVSTTISVLILAAVVGLIAYLGAAHEPTPPRFAVQIGIPRQEGAEFHVPFEVTNQGDRTAKEVSVQGRANTPTGEESAVTTFDYLPGKSKESGVFVFRAFVGEPEVRVVGYQLP